jgi:hypothetical protein
MSVELEVHSAEDRPIALWIEPWGDRHEIPVASRLRLVFEGEMIESTVIRWMEDAIWVGLPRYTLLRVFSESGEMLRDYDTRDLPPVPPGFRPI